MNVFVDLILKRDFIELNFVTQCLKTCNQNRFPVYDYQKCVLSCCSSREYQALNMYILEQII